MSLRKAIDNHCKSCIYDPLSGLGTWRQQTEACTMTFCSLHAVRPVSKPKKKTNGKVPDGLKRWQDERKSL